jgi:hypothetical protein
VHRSSEGMVAKFNFSIPLHVNSFILQGTLCINKLCNNLKITIIFKFTFAKEGTLFVPVIVVLVRHSSKLHYFHELHGTLEYIVFAAVVPSK